MTSRAGRVSIVAALLTVALAQGSEAGERKLFETVKGWEVEQNTDKVGPQTCQIAYSYKDDEDDDAENAVVLAADEQDVIVVLGYANWSWDKDQKVTAPIAFDKQVLNAKQAWIGNGTSLVTKIPETALPRLFKAKQIVLSFGRDTADFNVPDVTEAYASLKRCNATFDPANAPKVAAAPKAAPEPPKVAAEPPKAAAAPPAQMPSDDVLTAFGAGTAIQQVIATCEVGTTPKQRAEVDAKLLALQPALGSFAADLRAEIVKSNGSKCPTDAAGVAKFDFALKSFLALGTADFAAALNARIAEDEAKARSEAEAKAKAETEARMRAEIEAKMRAEIEAKNRAEAETRAKAEMEARIRSEVEAKLRAEAETRAKADADAKARADAETKAKADAEAAAK